MGCFTQVLAMLTLALGLMISMGDTQANPPKESSLDKVLAKMKKSKAFRLQGNVEMSRGKMRLAGRYEVRSAKGKSIYTHMSINKPSGTETHYAVFHKDHVLHLEYSGNKFTSFTKYKTPKNKSTHYKYLNKMDNDTAGNYIILYPSSLINELKKTSKVSVNSQGDIDVYTFKAKSGASTKYKGQFKMFLTKGEWKIKVLTSAGLPIEAVFRMGGMTFSISYQLQLMTTDPNKNWFDLPTHKLTADVKKL